MIMVGYVNYVSGPCAGSDCFDNVGFIWVYLFWLDSVLPSKQALALFSMNLSSLWPFLFIE